MSDDPRQDLPQEVSQEALTVAETAERLGVTERRLRHLLGRGDYAARCRQITRQTRSGRRQSAGIPPELLAEIASEINAAGFAAQGGDYSASGGNKAAAQGDATRHPAGGGERDHGELPVVFYRQRIADLEAMNADLRADKERLEADKGQLHDALRLAQENLAREQALRSVPALAAAEVDAAETITDRASQGYGFWARLWAKMKDERESG